MGGGGLLVAEVGDEERTTGMTSVWTVSLRGTRPR